ncbi:MAG: ATP-binding cassette domain-containing protein [Deltaproteobacteria bacterium]|nr:ATP-binding cassette domain-containing protein [Deltaproteobacteria bacterium]
MSALRLVGVGHHFPGAWGLGGREVLRDIHLEVLPGERVGLIGESGAGKSTLARIALGLLRPTAGAVHLLGEDTTGWSRARWRQARFHAQLLFQDPGTMLNQAMSLEQILAEGARLHVPDRDPVGEVLRVLEAVGLSGRGGARPGELSGGEQRRAGLARLLLTRPRLIVADEPTTGLDAGRKVELLELLYGAVAPECAVVLISHDLPLVQWACGRMVVMRGGAIVDRFDSEQLCSSDRPPYTRTLLRASGIRCEARA